MIDLLLVLLFLWLVIGAGAYIVDHIDPTPPSFFQRWLSPTVGSAQWVSRQFVKLAEYLKHWKS